MTQDSISAEIFVEKHNAFLKDGKPDDDYWQAKEGKYQFRIATVHYLTEEKARQRLQEILTSLDKAKKWDEHVALQADPRVKIWTVSLEEIKNLHKFKQDIQNLMFSLEVSDHDRYERKEPMIHQDTLAQYRLILKGFTS